MGGTTPPIRLWAAVVGLALAGALTATAPGAEDDVRSVIRIQPRALRDMRLMDSIGADMWSHGVTPRGVDFMVTGAQRGAVERAGIAFETTISDVDALIRAEHERLSAQQGGLAGADFFADFRPLGQIDARLDELAALHPARASVVVVGQSLEGRTIRGLRISALSDPAPAGTPAILFDACQHAREWATPPVAMYIAQRLLDDYGVDPEVTAIVDSAEVFIVPVVNVDGYAWTWASVDNRLWRKNRRINGDGTFGVDLNRNWGDHWGGAGSSATPSSDTYRGTSAFSEPETAAMRNFTQARPNLVANIDFHSFSQLVLASWGWTVEPAPQAALLQSIGNQMKAAILSTHAVDYIAGPIGSTLYLASGGSVDWFYASEGMLSWTIEVRDTGAYGFIMPPSEILPTIEENFAGAMVLAAAALEPAQLSLPAPLPSSVQPATPVSVAVNVFAPSGGAPLAVHALWRVDGAQWQSVSLNAVGNGNYGGAIPGAGCGSEIEVAFDAVYPAQTARLPDAGGFPIAVDSLETVAEDALEIAGWSLGATGDTATSGIWVHGDPVGTTSQPENDHTAAGTNCYFTGQGAAGGGAGSADVDGGATTLTTPPFDASAPGTVVSYFRWWANHLGGNPGQDSMLVSGSADDGATWTLLETVSAGNTAWLGAAINLDGLLVPSTSTRLRFVAADLGGGSLVEAAIDDFALSVAGCDRPADLDGSGAVDGADLGLMLAAWGASGAADLDGDGVVGGPDLAIMLADWG